MTWKSPLLRGGSHTRALCHREESGTGEDVVSLVGAGASINGASVNEVNPEAWRSDEPLPAESRPDTEGQ
jgi:hypothetical protein